MIRKAGFGFFLLLSLFAVAAGSPQAPDFTLPTASGTISLRELRGKVVYVDFWASWCAPCRESFSWMSTMAEKYQKSGLVVVAINLDKDREQAKRFLDQYTASFPVAFDPAGAAAEAFRVQAMPSSFIVSRNGAIVATHAGFEARTAPAVEQKIQEALSQ